jgi:hypothetical protein
VFNDFKFGGGKEMKKVICTIIIVISVFVYGFAMAAPGGGGGGPAPVTVTNTPLPVTGTVGISGTPNVNVTNSESNPVPVKGNINVSDPATRAVSYSCSNWCAVQSNVNCGCKITDVPAGKRLVIETISASADSFLDEIIFAGIQTLLNGDTFYVGIPLTFLGRAGDFYIKRGTLSARLYADFAVDSPYFIVSHDGSTTAISIYISVSGYLVDMP